MAADAPGPWTKACTLARLGLTNVLRVGTYRALLKVGFYRKLLPVESALSGPFFDWSGVFGRVEPPDGADVDAWVQDAQRVLDGELPVFSSRWVHCGFPPDWHRSVISGVALDGPWRHWSLIEEFKLPGGDVKGYWEPARFAGLTILALAWLGSRHEQFPSAIEQWLQSWSSLNPANAGVQWKCGQECSLRLLQMLLVAELLERRGGVRSTNAFGALVAQHCRRIAATRLYATAQDNNHGTSEAAALYLGGCYLTGHSSASTALGEKWRQMGRQWLEERMERLVLPDGSFSQHSTNYHRLMLDTCSLVETLRRRFAEPRLSEKFYARAAAATRWLAQLVEPSSGEAPNLGANDGARQFVLHRRPYDDFRPSVQWAAVLFLGCRQYSRGNCDEQLAWLGLEEEAPRRGESYEWRSMLWADGGYAKLTSADAWLIVRLPRYRFRPSQSDALHTDLWVGGANVAVDAGSFSYHAGEEWLRYFGGVQSHNTIEFDGRDQMPRISRFLFADWLSCEELSFSEAECTLGARYRDRWGATHERRVRLLPRGGCVINDTVAGFADRAILRWRLRSRDEAWRMEGNACRSGDLRIEVQCSAPVRRLELVDGWESRLYCDKQPIAVLELEVASPGMITTTMSWAS